MSHSQEHVIQQDVTRSQQFKPWCNKTEPKCPLKPTQDIAWDIMTGVSEYLYGWTCVQVVLDWPRLVHCWSRTIEIEPDSRSNLWIITTSISDGKSSAIFQFTQTTCSLFQNVTSNMTGHKQRWCYGKMIFIIVVLTSQIATNKCYKKILICDSLICFYKLVLLQAYIHLWYLFGLIMKLTLSLLISFLL